MTGKRNSFFYIDIIQLKKGFRVLMAKPLKCLNHAFIIVVQTSRECRHVSFGNLAVVKPVHLTLVSRDSASSL